MTSTEYDDAKATFFQHLEWIAQLSAAPETVPEPASPDKENDHISSSCPFSQGDIRLIVSEDETLGPVTKKE